MTEQETRREHADGTAQVAIVKSLTTAQNEGVIDCRSMGQEKTDRLITIIRQEIVNPTHAWAFRVLCSDPREITSDKDKPGPITQETLSDLITRAILNQQEGIRAWLQAMSAANIIPEEKELKRAAGEVLGPYMAKLAKRARKGEFGS